MSAYISKNKKDSRQTNDASQDLQKTSQFQNQDKKIKDKNQRDRE